MMNSKNTLAFNSQPLSIEDICRIAGQQAHGELSSQTDFIKRINDGALFIDALSKEQGSVYGVTIN
jgi:histidine ammonia-lyase